MSTSSITIRGAREHNLKNVTLTLPREALIVITGLSGSGKSSLAFDTLYAEGQRRYVESLSAYARQFLELMPKPDVESIDGLSPAIAIEQKTTSNNPRSTVGTVTEIYDYLRLLFARVGVPYSPTTGLPIESQSVAAMTDRILAFPEGTKLLLLAPVIRGRKGEYKREIEEWRKQGFQRLKINGTVYDIDDVPTLDKKRKHDLSVVVDRLIIKGDLARRVADSLETTLKLADGLATVEDLTSGETIMLSSTFACPVSGFTVPPLEPRLFSFNSPHGACPACDGLGETLSFDPDLVVPNTTKSLAGEAIAPWKNFYRSLLSELCRLLDVDMETPWQDLPENARDVLLNGSGRTPMIFAWTDGSHVFQHKKPFEGVLANLKRRWQTTESDWMRDELAQYQRAHPCTSCNGARLRPEALAVRVDGVRTIADVTAFTIGEAETWITNLILSTGKQTIAERIVREIRERLGFLNAVGLRYLTLNRASGTLSGGESQRIRLASQVGSGLTGVLYVLDEPSIGLHQRDNDRLLASLKRLRDLGNTVVVVEHDEDAIRQADMLVDMGPGAGTHGGHVVASGTPAEVFAHPESLTGQYMTGVKKIPIPKTRRKGSGALVLKGARGHNLKNVTMTVPLGTLTCVTGVSGSGKSTLVIETLWRALAKTLNGAHALPEAYDVLTGTENLDKVIDIDQSPIGRTPRSNPATYTGAFTPIREWFSKLPEARARGYQAGRFSFNVKGGRCEACQGDGVLKIEMHFLPDVFVTCETCNGTRYNRETLEVTWQGRSIADVLTMTVEEATTFFEAVPAIRDKMRMLERVGLGYIHVGQAATTLSGGEAQRVKLSKELARRATGRTLYILDEPTTGLHMEDVRKLLEVLHALVDQGNTVLVIEHNLDVIKTADHVIDIGPEGGDAGGHILVSGTPETIAKCRESYTGAYLKNWKR